MLNSKILATILLGFRWEESERTTGFKQKTLIICCRQLYNNYEPFDVGDFHGFATSRSNRYLIREVGGVQSAMQKTQLLNISITRTVVSILLFTTLFIQIAVGGVFYLWQRSSQYNELKLQLQQVSEQAAHHLESPMWNFDKEQIIQVVHNSMLIPAISRITVKNQFGETLEDHTDDEMGSTDKKTAYNQISPVVRAGEQLGSVRVYISTEPTDQRLHQYLITIFFSILMLAIVQIVTIYLLLSKTIIHPLKAIENYAAGISSQATSLPDPPKELFAFELQNLCSSITDMVCALQNSEKSYRSIFENSLEGIFQTTLQGDFLKINSAIVDILGYGSPEELKNAGNNIEQHLQLDSDKRSDLLERVKDQGKVAGREMSLRHKAGHTLHCLISMHVVFDERGETACLEGSLVDITARKLAEEQLANLNQHLESLVEQRTGELKGRNAELIASEERYRNLVETMQEGILVLDQDGRLTYVNQQMSNMLGMTAGELIGRECTDFIETKHRKIFETHLKAADGQAALKFEMNFTRADGHSVATLATPTSLYDGTGQYLGSFAVVTDITHLKQLQTRLLHAQKLESIGQLAAGMAHEINTPNQYVVNNARFLDDAFKEFLEVLTAYQGLFTAIKNGLSVSAALEEVEKSLEKHQLESLFEEIPGAFRDTFEGLERIANIVSSVKRFAHPGQDATALADLNDAIRNTISVSTNEWKYVAKVETDLDPALSPVVCDISAINQVVLNLIVNAAHAIADNNESRNTADKGTITVQTRNRGDQVEIRIADTGGGIPEDIRNRIFDPFFTTKVVGKGSGQGLAIARTIITESHHGSIDFETEIGRGTTFIIRLPLIVGNNTIPVTPSTP
ncbi:MAG: PAS domain S-box protein [Proteobacteria bacterium]|nr:PAS domain S-box protein [Pseudomonadota bacterium]